MESAGSQALLILFGSVISVLLGLGVYMLRDMKSTVSKIQEEFHDFEVRVAKDYVTKSDMHSYCDQLHPEKR